MEKKVEVKKLPTGYAEGTGTFYTVGISKSGNQYYYESSPPELDHETRACRAMWRAVITQSIMDAKGLSKKLEKRAEKHRAEYFLFHDEIIFPIICRLADFEPEYVRRKCIEARSRNYVWKNVSGIDEKLWEAA